MKRLFLVCLWLTLMFVAPTELYALSGHYVDPGGGSYWCNVYPASVSHGMTSTRCGFPMNRFRLPSMR